MLKKEEELNKFYKDTLLKFDKYTDKKPGDFIDDVILLNCVILSEKFQFGFKSFWTYFTTKYELDLCIKKYFDNDKDLARTIYYKCVTPLNLKLDIAPTEIKPDSGVYKSLFFRFFRWIKYSLKELVMSTIALVVIFFSVIMSYYYYENELFWYSNSFIGLATGVLAGVVIKWVNSYIRNNVILLESQKVLASRYTKTYISRIEESILKFIKSKDNNEKEDIILSFCDINNHLNNYMKSIIRFRAVKTLKEYFLLVKYEKEIFEYSKEIVRRLYPSNVDHLTNKEIDELNLYVLRLKQHNEDYMLEYSEAIQKIDFSISRMNSKTI